MSIGDFFRGHQYMLLYHLRTIVYTAVTCVAIFAVWYTGNRANDRLRHQARISCVQAVELTDAVNSFHGSLKRFLIAAAKARESAPRTRANVRAARAYEDILHHIHIVPPPVCAR